MSKPIKEMIVDDYKKRFDELEGAVIVDIRGVTSNQNNTLRRGLQKKDIRVTIIKNTLAKKAFKDTKLAALSDALEGPTALAYGAESVVDVAREIVDWAKKIKNLTLKAAVLDGQLYAGEKGVKALSNFPTKMEAGHRGEADPLAGRKPRPGRDRPGSNILGIVKEIQERLEKGTAIAKVA